MFGNVIDPIKTTDQLPLSHHLIHKISWKSLTVPERHVLIAAIVILFIVFLDTLRVVYKFGFGKKSV